MNFEKKVCEEGWRNRIAPTHVQQALRRDPTLDRDDDDDAADAAKSS